MTKAKQRAVASHSPMQIGFAIAQAIRSLKEARDALRLAGCTNAADYVARALKSAEGAQRHARSMEQL